MANTQNITKYQSADKIMMRILQDIGLDSTEQVANEQLWIRWIFEAMNVMRLPITFGHRKEKIPIVEGVVLKPLGYLSPVRLLLEIDGNCFTPILTSRPAIEQRGNPPRCDIRIVEFPNYWQVNSGTEGFLIAEYKSYFFDRDGHPMVPETYYLPISMYCHWKWMQRENGPGRRVYNANDVEAKKIEWKREASNSRSRQVFEDWNHDYIDQIMARYNNPRLPVKNHYSQQLINNKMQEIYRGTQFQDWDK